MSTTAEATEPATPFTPAAAAATTSGEPAGRRGFRPDIDGLRAVAILLVVLYHASVPGFGAGFIGVDVFFVISGFLIMGQLEGEIRRTGTLRLGNFWARRARRLLPAATLTLIFVAIVTPLVVPVFLWKSVAAEVLASAFYVANELFRSRTVDYFAAQVTTSPLLNMWSLAVEEQFYLFWPVILFVTSRVTKWLAGEDQDRAHRQRVVTVMTVVALSFVVSLGLTQNGTQAAYFSSVSRAWEFGIGALLAMLVPGTTTWRPSRTRPVGAVGVVLLATAFVIVNSQTPFPGVAALLPVLGTAAIIIAGVGSDTLPARTLGCRPLQAVGRVSYSWYLWHWPVLVLGLRWRPDRAVWWHVALVALALIPALAAHRFVERPFRTWPVLTSSNRRTLLGIVALIAISAGSAGVLWLRADSILQDPFMAQVEATRLDRPPLPEACATTDVAVLSAECVWGDRGASRTVLLLGDSHASHWLAAVDQVGQNQHLRVIASMQGSCPATGFGWAGELPSCAHRIATIPELVRTLRPDLVVVGTSRYTGSLLDAEGRLLPADAQLGAWKDGVRDRAQQLKDLGIAFLMILDVPQYRDDAIECLMRERSAEPCAVPLAPLLPALEPLHGAERAGIAEAGHGATLDPLPLLCPDGRCPAIDRGVIVYADRSHLSPAYSRVLEGPVWNAMNEALANRQP